MAETKIKFVLEADPGQVIDALIKVNQAQQTTIDGMRKMNREGKDTGRMFGELGSILGIGGGIYGGLALIRSQTQMWNEDVKQIVQKFTDVNKELVLAISRSGDLANFPEIQEKLKTISMPGIGPAERTEIYRALRGELPMESIATIMGLMPEAGKAKIMEEPKEFATRMGTTFQLYRGKLTPGDVADVTKVVGTMLGGNAEKYGTQVLKQAMQLQAVGMEPDKALAMMIAIAEQGQLKGAGTLTGLLTAEKTFERRKPGQRFTEQEKAEREFYAIEDPQKRLEWLMANKGKGGKAAAVISDQGVLAAISQVNIEQVAENIRRARELDYFEKSRRLAIGTQPGAMLLRGEELEAQIEETKLSAGERFARTRTAKQMLELGYQRYLRTGIPGAALFKAMSTAWLETGMALGMPPEMALKTTPLAQGWGALPGAFGPGEMKKAFTVETISSKDVQELTKAIKDLTVIEKNKQNQNTIIINPGSGMLD